MGMVRINSALGNAGIALTDLYIFNGKISSTGAWQRFDINVNINVNDEYIIYAKDIWTSPHPVVIWRVKTSGGVVSSEIIYDERGALSYPQLITNPPNAAGWFSLGVNMSSSAYAHIAVIYKFR